MEQIYDKLSCKSKVFWVQHCCKVFLHPLGYWYLCVDHVSILFLIYYLFILIQSLSPPPTLSLTRPHRRTPGTFSSFHDVYVWPGSYTKELLVSKYFLLGFVLWTWHNFLFIEKKNHSKQSKKHKAKPKPNSFNSYHSELDISFVTITPVLSVQTGESTKIDAIFYRMGSYLLC